MSEALARIEEGLPDKKKPRLKEKGSTMTTAASLSTKASSSSSSSQPEISLTEHEIKLFDILRGAAAKAGQGTVLRVAGGWVRDKLLGRESDDVDLALDNVSGTTFAEAVNQHMAEQGLETHTFGVIQANPDQSKHLETAKIMILGQWVDFTNLRTETYRADSRIPEITFGTAEEDAHRRDFTINAMFYNLNTSAVEDFTGQGWADLLGPHRVIRTPLPAHTTFLDDPLRLLRAIRFAARFDLPLHEDIRKAVEDADLREALVEKVSRERFGIEMDGMLSGKDARPAVAFELLVSLGLANAVFHKPLAAGAIVEKEKNEKKSGEDNSASLSSSWEQVGLATVRMVNVLLMHGEDANTPLEGDIESLIRLERYRRPRRDHRLLFLAALLVGWVGRSALDKKKKQVDAIQLLARESLKLKNKEVDELTLMFRMIDQFSSLAAQASGEIKRVNAGLLLREAKDLWKACLDLACARDMARAKGRGESLGIIMQRYRGLKKAVEAMGLHGCWSLKPLLDGKAIIGSLGIPKGPLVGQIMGEQVRWQLGHPEGTVEDLTNHLRSFASDLPKKG